MTTINRNYKDSLFRLIFNDRNYLLSLYNTVNGTHHTDADHLEINTLENAIFLKMKNDISFLFHTDLSLYEHQSTFTPNMPLRDLFYLHDLLQKLVRHEDLYRRRRIVLPVPRFLVFYNGTEPRPETEYLHLSNLYEIPQEDPSLELTVTVFNINPGFHEELKEACEALDGYTAFVTKFREYSLTMEPMAAADRALTECIKENRLREFFLTHRAEVVNLTIYEYDEEQHLATVREEGREEERANTEAEHLKAEAARAEAEAALKRAEDAEREIERLKALREDIPINPIYVYNEEQHLATVREEGREEGREEERANTEAEHAKAEAARAEAEAALKRAEDAEQEVALLRARIKELEASRS